MGRDVRLRAGPRPRRFRHTGERAPLQALRSSSASIADGEGEATLALIAPPAGGCYLSSGCTMIGVPPVSFVPASLVLASTDAASSDFDHWSSVAFASAFTFTPSCFDATTASTQR